MIRYDKYVKEYHINNISKVYIHFVQPIFCYFIIIILHKNIQMIFWQYIVSYYKKKLSIFLMIQCNKYLREYHINNISKVYIHFVQPIFCYFIIVVLYKNIQMIFWQYIVSYYKKKLSIFLMIQCNKYVKEYLINNISKVYIHFVQRLKKL